MKKIISVLTAAAVCSALFLTGCERPRPDGADCSFDYAMVGHPESLDPQYASDKCSLTVIGNLYTGLLERSDKGELINAAAEDYTVSEDGLTYNFKLRKNCFWFIDENEDEEVDDSECFSVTAYDFEFAFRRIFNPETCSPHRETYACIKNAQDIIDGKKDYTEIGVHALSDRDLVIELDYSSNEFLESLALTPAMPCNEKFFYDTKGRYGLDDKSVMSNGAFFVRQWFYDPYGHDNFIYMQRNLANSDYNKIYPTALNIYMKDSYEDSKKSFEDGESDVIMAFKCSEKQKEEYNVEKYDNYTIGLVTNPENPEYSNKSIRKALAYGIDRSTFKEKTSEDLSEAYGLVPPGISIDGKSYRSVSEDKNVYIDPDGNRIEYDPELAVKFYRDGMGQMGLKSLSNTKLLVPKDLMDIEYLHLVTQNWQTLFGFYIGIEEVSVDEFYDRIEEKDYALAIYPLTGNYNSPMSFVEHFTSSVNTFGYKNGDVDNIAHEIEKSGGELKKFEKAETAVLRDFYFIPLFYKSEYEIMGSGNHDILYDPFTKQLFFRYAKYYED